MKGEFQKRSLLSILFFLGIYIGIGSGAFFTFPFGTLLFWSIGVLLLMLCLVSSFWFRVSVLFCLGMVIGCWVYQVHVRQLDHAPLYQYDEQKVTVEGIVCDTPDRRSDHTKLTLCITSMRTPVSTRIQGRILVSLSKFQSVSYGDLLVLSGTLQVPMEDETFSYRNYLRKDGITHLMSRPQLTILATGQGHPLWQTTFYLKDQIESHINRLWHEPEASFLAGLLIGSRKGIPQEVLTAFQHTGLTHIIAISGYNITLLIIIVTSLLSFLPRRIQLVTSMIVIFCFTILVGASSAVVRAAIMGIIGLCALLLYRTSTVLITVLLSGVLMLLFKPLLLLYDVGFQLSFLAVLGLISMQPLLGPLTRYLPEHWGIREGFTMTLSATITTTPAILHHFGLFSIISPLANVLVAPFLPFAMLFGFLALCTSWLPPLSFLFQLLTTFCLQVVIHIAQFGAAIPGAFVEIQRLELHGVFLAYSCIVFALLLQQFFMRDTANNDTVSRQESSFHDRAAPRVKVVPSDG